MLSRTSAVVSKKAWNSLRPKTTQVPPSSPGGNWDADYVTFDKVVPLQAGPSAVRLAPIIDDRLHERHVFRASGDGWDELLLQP